MSETKAKFPIVEVHPTPSVVQRWIQMIGTDVAPEFGDAMAVVRDNRIVFFSVQGLTAFLEDNGAIGPMGPQGPGGATGPPGPAGDQFGYAPSFITLGA